MVVGQFCFPFACIRGIDGVGQTVVFGDFIFFKNDLIFGPNKLNIFLFEYLKKVLISCKGIWFVIAIGEYSIDLILFGKLRDFNFWITVEDFYISA